MYSEILYLLKFLPEFEYASLLQIRGQLYMRPVGYFAELERKDPFCHNKGDSQEGSCFDEIAIYKDHGRPIYCMTSVMAEDLVDMPSGKKAIMINPQLFSDFFRNSTKGYVVVIKYKPFMHLLVPPAFNGYAVACDLVRYCKKSFEKSIHLLTSEDAEQVFIKRPQFSYQKEFRICTFMSLERASDEAAQIRFFEKHRIKCDFKTWDGVAFIAEIGSLSQFSHIYSKKDFLKPLDKSDSIILPLCDNLLSP